jgi:hypothetical protein
VTAVIDAKTEELKREAPGVPFEAIRLTLTSPYRGDAIDSALAILLAERN